MVIIPLLDGSSDDIIKANIKELMATGKYTQEQAAAIAYEKAGRKPKANAQELTYEYLKAFYDHVMEHPHIFKELTDEIHIKSRAKSGGQLHGMLKVNASAFGGKVIEATEEVTIIPAVLMAEGVRNGGLHRYEDFAHDVRWFEGVPIVPPHLASDPLASLVNQKTNKLGQIRNVKLNADKRRVEAEAVLFNSKFNPDDLARIQSGEAFGGSIGFFADDEMLPEKQTWHDGKEYNRIEKNFFGNHFSIVADPACPLGTCGFNVNEANEMTETKTTVAEAIKTNATDETPTDAKAVVEAPKVNVENHIDLSTVLNKLDALAGDFATFKANAASKDAEIAALKAAEEVRVNAQKAAEDALVLSTLDNMLLPAFKDKASEMLPAFKANAALWIAQNPDKIDLAAFTKPSQITPAGQAFVPHVNASEDDDLNGLMPTDEEAGMRKVA
ncbi:MAG: hypothetical protein WC124_01930 [Desulfoplanes sp.]